MKFKKFAAVLLAATMLASAAAGCGKDKIEDSAVAATLDGQEIPLGVANFIAQYRAVQYDSYLLSYYGEDMWNSDDGSGSTMTDSVKGAVMDDIEEYYLMQAHMADYGVTLTDEENSEITAAAKQFMEDNTKDAQEKLGATQENVEQMLRLNKIQAKMRAAIIADVNTDVSKKECAQKTFSYVKFEKADADTAADDESAADKEQADPKEQAEAFLAKLEDGDMDKAAKDGGYTVSTCSYGAADLNEEENSTGLALAALQEADKLKDKEVAPKAVEADGVYYVIRMDAVDDKEASEKKKASIVKERQDEKYNEVLAGYKDACKWEVVKDEWAKVNFDELYKLEADETQAEDTSADTAAE